MEPVPAGSKTDLPLAKAEPISNGGSASATTHIRRGEGGELCNSYCSRLQSSQHVRERTLQTPRSVKKEVEKVLQALEQRFPCSS